MFPRALLAILVFMLVFATACGGDGDDEDADVDAGEPTSAVESTDAEESDSDEQELTASYLEGEWCARVPGDTAGTTYVFDGDSYEYGRGGNLGSGSNIQTFLIGVRLVSMDDDEFVSTQLGRETTYTRGPCG